LRQSNELAGVFCLGYEAGSQAALDLAQQGKEFADRLSVVLANVAHEEQLYRQAHYDPMTQLPNRQLFRDRLAGELARIGEGTRGALLYIDLDRFKGVNDTGGHDAGDELLRIVGQRISCCIKEGDTVARLGGDEFAVILHGAGDPQHVRGVAERILEMVARPIAITEREYYIGASIGISMYPGDGTSAEELLKNGDIAMYRAKEAGRGRVLFYESEMNARVQAWASVETGLHRALREHLFELHWQPIIAAQGGQVIAAEALLRWTGTSHSPATFVPVAEASGLIIELGDLVLDAALQQLSSWRTRGVSIPAVSVNVSPRQLREPLFAKRVRECLRRYELDPPCLQLEITEGVMAESSPAERSLRALADAGVLLALDDFGTGYSSLSYLRSLPVHTVKIDRSFITEVPTSRTASQLVETIIVMCRTLNKSVIAEGVETPAQLEFLEQRGCDAIQGYLLAAPAPADSLTAWLEAGHDEQRRRAVAT
jgi:diguanylate cyclase (GGDEF)-like protein